jgi:hypothetical protein
MPIPDDDMLRTTPEEKARDIAAMRSTKKRTGGRTGKAAAVHQPPIKRSHPRTKHKRK